MKKLVALAGMVLTCGAPLFGKIISDTSPARMSTHEVRRIITTLPIPNLGPVAHEEKSWREKTEPFHEYVKAQRDASSKWALEYAVNALFMAAGQLRTMSLNEVYKFHSQTLTELRNSTARAWQELRKERAPASSVLARAQASAKDLEILDDFRVTDAYKKPRPYHQAPLFVFLRNQGCTDVNTIRRLLNGLEETEYLLKKNKYKLTKEQTKEYIALAQHLLTHTREMFPTAITSVDGERLNATKNKALLIMILEAQQIQLSLEKLFREAGRSAARG